MPAPSDRFGVTFSNTTATMLVIEAVSITAITVAIRVGRRAG